MRGKHEAPCLISTQKNVPFHATSLAIKHKIIFEASITPSVNLPLKSAILSFKIVGTSLGPVMGLINSAVVAAAGHKPMQTSAAGSHVPTWKTLEARVLIVTTSVKSALDIQGIAFVTTTRATLIHVIHHLRNILL